MIDRVPSWLGVAIVSNGRCLPLLAFVLQTWTTRGARVALVTDRTTALALSAAGAVDSVRLAVVPDTGPPACPANHQLAIELCDQPAVYVGADDVLPVANWDRAVLHADAVQAIRLLDVLGRDHYSWAASSIGIVGTTMAACTAPATYYSARTYITGNAQLIGRAVYQRISYARCPIDAYDVHYCRQVQAAGLPLYPPVEGGPVAVHLSQSAVVPPSLKDQR